MHTEPAILVGDLDEHHCQLYLSSRSLAVDTETMGLNTKRDRLCVVQMCNENGVAALVLVHGASAPRLKQVLEADGVEKIFHFARFDLAALRHWLGIRVQPIYCTKIASRLARTYAPSHSLKTLVQELLGIELSKEQQSSDWGRRPISPQQAVYAAADVLYLIALKEKLEFILEREGRQELARACIDFLPHRVDLDLAGWENDDLFSHV